VPACARIRVVFAVVPFLAALAACGSESGPSAPPSVATVTVTPGAASLLPNTTLQLAFKARDASGTELSRTATWKSGDATRLTIDASGLATGVAPGVVTATATVEGVSGSTTLTVLPSGAIAFATLAPSDTLLSRLDTFALRVSASDVNHVPIDNPAVTWSSSDTRVATVDAAGRIAGRDNGEVTITAKVGDVVATVPVRIGDPRSVGVTIFRVPDRLVVRSIDSLAAAGVDRAGGLFYIGPSTWTSDAPGVISIDPTGNLRVHAAGQATITAFVTDTMTGKVRPASVVLSASEIPPFASISVSDQICAVTAAGAGYCWGPGADGRVPLLVPGGHQWASISVGGNHACGVTTAGAGYCWGANGHGQLGNGGTAPASEPSPVAGGLTFTRIEAGRFYSCGVTTGGAAYCWGDNHEGELGNGTMNESTVPVPVSGGHQFASLALASMELRSVTCGVTVAGAGYCWGANQEGQLGTGDSASSAIPRAVVGGIQFVEIGTGGFHSCGRATDGASYCWGANPRGNFGDGTVVSDPRPAPVLGGPYQSLTANYLFGCGVRVGGTLACWGQNPYNELGVIGPDETWTPVDLAVPGVSLVQVRSGASRSCALSSVGVAYCWGYQVEGYIEALGWARVPTRVVGQP
jgi:hypothetical protein